MAVVFFEKSDKLKAILEKELVALFLWIPQSRRQTTVPMNALLFRA